MPMSLSVWFKRRALYTLVDTRRLLGESRPLAALGALLGGGLAWMFFNGLAASPLGMRRGSGRLGMRLF